METLFTRIETARRNDNAPLAARMRPRTLEGYFGQEQAVGPGSWLRRAIEHDTLSSVILYGPAGTGKTTLARIIAQTTHAEFVEVSAITGTVKDLRREIEAAESRLLSQGRRTILFVDEIHRFNRSQQDALLHAVEDRTVVLVGATTENPSFEVISPLLSRCQVYVLKAMEESDLQKLLDRAIATDTVLQERKVRVEQTAALFRFSGGDARKLLNIIDILSNATEGEIVISDRSITECLQQNIALYDKNGEQHYDVISAFIKSVRGSDPNAAIYYLARMLAGGEEPRFLARRLVILASEDIGLANPNALLLAYPVVTAGEYAHRDSFVQLTGTQDVAAHQRFTLEDKITPATPPVFVWHTMEDETVPVENALLLLSALHKAGVPCEAHLFEKGCHGTSISTPEVDADSTHRHRWVKLAAEWLNDTFSFHA